MEAALSGFDSLSSAVLLFVLFRLVYSSPDGAATLGSWTLIQGLMVVSRIADSGMGANVTRYVRTTRPLDSGRTDLAIAALMSTAAPVSVLSVAVAFPIYLFVSSRAGAAVSLQSLQLLTAESVLFAVLNAAALALLSIAEGRGRLAERNSVVLLSNGLALCAAPFFIADFGAVGVGAVYVVMALLQFVCATGLQWRPARLEGQWVAETPIGATARRFFREGAPLTGIALVRLSFEPLTRLFLSLVVAIDVIPAFELALRVVSQVRILFSAASQPLLGVGSRRSKERLSAAAERTYSIAEGLLRGSSSWVFASLVFCMPVVSLFSLHSVSRTCLAFALILSMGNWVNALSSVSYLHQISGGAYASVLRIHLVMAVLCVGLGSAGVLLKASMLIVAGYSIAFACGGILSIRARHASVIAGFAWAPRAAMLYQVSGDAAFAVACFLSVLCLSGALAVGQLQIDGFTALGLLSIVVAVAWALVLFRHSKLEIA